MKKFLSPKIDGAPAIGLLILRLVAGYAMFLHGQPKMANPTGWMGADSSTPGFLQAIAAVSETVGGLALMAGFLTPLAALAIAGTMVGAFVLSLLPRGVPFVAGPGQPSYELAALFLAMSVMFLLTGPGKLSVDGAVFRGKGR